MLASCESSNTYYSNSLMSSNYLTLEDVSGDFEFILLDDSCDESIIPDVWNVKISDDYIFVLSAKSGVFQFNRKGEFLRKISQQGKGPGEWSTIIDIAIDEIKNLIYIYDYTGKIMIFSIWDGLYIDQLEMPGKMFSKIHAHGNNLFIAPYNSMGNEESMLYCLDIDNFSIQSAGNLPNFVLTDFNHMLYSFTKGIISNDSTIYVHPNLSSTVYEYEIKSNSIIESFSISFAAPLSPELRGMGYEGLKKSQTIMDIAKNNHYFFVKISSYSTEGEWYAIDKTCNETYKLDLKYSKNSELKFSPKYQANTFVADLIYVSSFNENSQELLFISNKVGKEITPNSNPLIVIWNE